MKRQRVSLAEVAARDNLALATWKAARGKRGRPAVARWLQNLDERLDHLAQRILDGDVPRGLARRFTVHDPKRRLITAACFDDRVLHHALLNVTEAQFDRGLAPSVYACRPGRGVHAAVAAVQRGLRAHAWVVHIDIDSYFPSIRHDVLLAQLHRRFKGQDFLHLLGRIVASGQGAPGRGLPIGALSSQHFANAHLDPADRLLEALPEVAAPVRYMDDLVWFCPTQEAARRSLHALRGLLADDLHLRVKPGVVLRPSGQGLCFCGCRVRQGDVLPGARRMRRHRQAVERLRHAEALGHDQADLQRAHDVALAALLPSRADGWRRRLWWGTGL